MCEEYIQKLLLKWTLKWVVSKEQKSIIEEIITLSCTHLTFRFLYFVVSQHRKLMQVHMSFKSLVTHRSDISVFIPPVCSPHWAEIICLHYLSWPGIQLSLDGRPVRVLLMSVSLAPAHGCTFTIHALTESSQVTWGNPQSFPEEPLSPPDFLQGPLLQKEVPIVSIHPKQLSRQ